MECYSYLKAQIKKLEEENNNLVKRCNTLMKCNADYRDTVANLNKENGNLIRLYQTIKNELEVKSLLFEKANKVIQNYKLHIFFKKE